MINVDKFFERLTAAFKTLFEAVKNIWRKTKEIKEFVEDYQYIPATKPKWHITKKMPYNVQVLNRKPRMVVARSNC
jgi:hypothetical protein